MRRHSSRASSAGRSPSRAPAPTTRRSPSLRHRSTRVARKQLGRSLSIREVDAGSCNGCELEIHALNNAFYDLERFGLRFVASPRHADVLMVTGPVTKNMREALERTYAATPAPKWVVAVGDCAADGGIFAGQLCGRRRRLASRAGRPPHPRLPADADGAAQGPAGAHFRRLTCREAGRAAARFAFVPSLRTIQAGA